MHPGQARVRYLDGLRGVAILLVVAWHYLGPVYAMHLPYGARWAGLPMVGSGWAGVNLFFLISGYVIFLTLERCRGIGDFLARRWLRLFPAMLVASVLIFAAAQAMAPWMPGGTARLRDLAPGLLLVDPIFFEKYLGVKLRSLDGAFWSLYVEAAFYLAIAPLYFRLGWARAIAGLLIVWAVLLVMPPIAYRLHLVHWMAPPYRILRYAGVAYWGWFASGALFLKAREKGSRGLFAMAIAIGCVASTTVAIPDLVPKSARAALFGCVILFALAARAGALQRLLAIRPLVRLGFVSYPFYLIHSALGVGLIALLGRALPASAAIVLVTIAMLLLAWGIAAWAEPALARLLRPRIRRLERRLDIPAAPQVAQPIGTATPATSPAQAA